MPPVCLSQKYPHYLTKGALLASMVIGAGLSACSSSQMTPPVSEPSSSTINQEAANQSAVDSMSVVASEPVMTMQNAVSSNMLIRAAPQMGIRPLPSINIAPQERDNYQKSEANPVHRTTEMAVSTLSIDTDTGSYANVRRYLNEGRLPPVDAVRVEELINYFQYQFDDGKRLNNAPFVVATDVVDSPWDRADQDNKIVKVGIKAVDSNWSKNSNAQSMPPANLVFLVDVSGSMSSLDKLPLAQSSLKLLTEQMRAEDSISIVTYSGSNNSKSSTQNTQNVNELAYLKIRYKAPAGGGSKLLSQPIYKTSRALNSANIDTQFAVAVAGFGQRLTQNEYINDWQYADSKKLASSVLARQPSSDKDGIRRNFVTLTELATVLDGNKS
ncbi:hypothetical protein A3K91_2403 [Psychrobacter alimentarius]|uniref:VWFA domain-containing protein n=2 Tax=Moraxellaceae TaxID=468 RepID=A0ABN4N4S4_9GAMM|nr:hypothetical protein A3K91_2403 [Psychrobacter alimentarius]QCB31987.1 DUF3520 domain-containing protein [Psychrobacter sp. PAMC27889]